jgi:hypothetical protein
MKVVFRTNVDHYKTNCWPENLTIPPRIGEHVLVTEVFEQYYIGKRLPTKMKVHDVLWTNKGVICELVYRDIDIEKAKISGVNLFG